MAQFIMIIKSDHPAYPAEGRGPWPLVSRMVPFRVVFIYSLLFYYDDDEMSSKEMKFSEIKLKIKNLGNFKSLKEIKKQD